MKKFELTNQKIIKNRTTLYRIKALIDIDSINVKAGDLGGWIEKEDNLSHLNNAWIFGDAIVYDNAKVSGYAIVSGNARVFGDAEISGNAEVSGNTRVFGNTKVFGDAEISGNARVFGDAKVYGNTEVYGNARIFGDAKVFGDTKVYDNAEVSGNTRVFGNAKVSGDAEISGNTEVSGNAEVYGNAIVFKSSHWLSIGPLGSRNGFTTFYRNIDNNISVRCGCFDGNITEFKDKVIKTHNDNKHAKAYLAAIELAKIQIELD